MSVVDMKACFLLTTLTSIFFSFTIAKGKLVVVRFSAQNDQSFLFVVSFMYGERVFEQDADAWLLVAEGMVAYSGNFVY